MSAVTRDVADHKIESSPAPLLRRHCGAVWPAVWETDRAEGHDPQKSGSSSSQV